ncbi:hypothetical protein OG320_16010 [Microbispora sp. NBC_01189]|uniref:LGFP repeat-containing protein n=1 Tax=Microbispora sp. NBC_01189 TaxID=2903583 RepID=UPI002E0EFE78|nr:hypothetical protein OG320_16010 [Microbispora sp. NBC_01189]
MKRIAFGLAAAAITGLAVTIPVTVTATSAFAATSGCDSSLVAPAGSLIGNLWRSNGGESSVYGCPVSKEYGYPDKRGSWQEFRNGKIVWSPNLGNGTLVRAYRSGHKVVFRWSGLGRDWDYFNVRWSKDGGKATQVKVGRIDPWSGSYSITPYCDGEVCSTTAGHEVNKFAFIVQGCDRSGLFQAGSECGPWSIPTSVRVAH